MTQPAKPRPAVAFADLILALGIIAVGIFFLLGAFSIEVNPGYARVGPRFFPLLVAGGFLLVGAWMAVEAWQGKQAQPAGEEDADPDAPINWGAFGWLSLGLALDMLLMNPLGFVIASSLLFWCGARAFQSKRPWRDLVAGVILSLIAYLAFTRGLGLNLPAGIFAGWL